MVESPTQSPTQPVGEGAPQRAEAHGASVAAVLLVALVVLSPWAFGGTPPRVTQAITVLAAVGGLAGWLRSARRIDTLDPWARRALCAFSVLWLLGVLQLVPLPPSLHAVVAPGSAAVWHPAPPAAAAVLGTRARPVSLDPAATLRWLAFTGALVGLGLAARLGLRTRTALLRATVAVVTGGVLVAVYGLVARLLLGTRLYGVFEVPTIAPFGPFVSKNHFAGYVELTACLAIGLAAGLADEARRGPDWLSWLESRRAGCIVAAWGAAAALVLAVPVSLSRGGVVSLTAGVAAFAAIRLTTRSVHGVSLRAFVVGAAILLLAVVIVATLVPNEVRTRVASLSSGDAYRFSVWRDSLRLVASSPAIGSGLGAFEEALPRFKTGAGDVRVEHAENDYLELLCDVGGLGLGLALLAAGGVLLRGWRSTREETHRLTRGIRAGALAGLCAMAVHSAFDFNLHIPSSTLLAVLLLALAGSDGSVPEGASGPRRLVCAVSLTGSLLIALIGPWGTADTFDANTLRRVTGPDSRLRGASVEREVEAHLQRRPADAAAWAALAWLRLTLSPGDASDLAAWSQTLDPQHGPLRAASQRIRDAARFQSLPHRSITISGLHNATPPSRGSSHITPRLALRQDSSHP